MITIRPVHTLLSLSLLCAATVGCASAPLLVVKGTASEPDLSGLHYRVERNDLSRKVRFHDQDAPRMVAMKYNEARTTWGSPLNLLFDAGLADDDEAVAVARRHDPRVIIEAPSTGKEVECSLLGHGEVMASVPGEIVTHGDWYDYEHKYSAGGMDLKVPAEIDESAAERLRELAVRVFKLCGCSGLARCDFFLEEDGRGFLLNEVNTMPGFTPISMYPKLWIASGVSYSALIDELVALAVERRSRRRTNTQHE